MSHPVPLLEVSGLTLQSGQRTLIHDLTMSVHAGDMWCILGANGVGKSMFLNTLVGLRPITTGTVLFSGKPAKRWSAPDLARQRGFLPQTIHDSFSAPVLDIVLLGRHPHLSRWSWEAEEDRAIALAALHAVGLADFAERDISALSGGERQRVAIAALLAQDAPLLLLDEPVTHMDIYHQILVLRHLAHWTRSPRRAVVYSVHDLNLAFRFATHAMLFRDDGTVDQGRTGDVMNHAALSVAFRYPVTQVTAGQRTLFVPN